MTQSFNLSWTLAAASHWSPCLYSLPTQTLIHIPAGVIQSPLCKTLLWLLLTYRMKGNSLAWCVRPFPASLSQPSGFRSRGSVFPGQAQSLCTLSPLFGMFPNEAKPPLLISQNPVLFIPNPKKGKGSCPLLYPIPITLCTITS